MRFIIALLIALMPMQLAHAQDKKIVKVTASFSILADTVKKIGGSRVVVDSIVPPNGDAHSFEAKPSDSSKLKTSELLVVQGLGLDNFVDKLASAADFKGEKIIASKGIKLRKGEEEDHDEHEHDHHDHGAYDPHTWQNPMNMIITARNITSGLVKVDPAGAAVYEANLASFSTEMRALDEFAHKQFDQIPPARRVMITTHDAFGYLGDAYGIKILPALGFSTVQDNSAENMAKLIDQARTAGTKAIFLENVSNPEILNTIAKELHTQPAAELYSDALSDGPPAGSYSDMFRYNVMQIAGAMAK